MVRVQVLSFRNSLRLLDTLLGLASLARLQIVINFSGRALVCENTFGKNVHILIELSVSPAVLQCLVLVHWSAILLVNAPRVETSIIWMLLNVTLLFKRVARR